MPVNVQCVYERLRRVYASTLLCQGFPRHLLVQDGTVSFERRWSLKEPTVFSLGSISISDYMHSKCNQLNKTPVSRMLFPKMQPEAHPSSGVEPGA